MVFHIRLLSWSRLIPTTMKYLILIALLACSATAYRISHHYHHSRPHGEDSNEDSHGGNSRQHSREHEENDSGEHHSPEHHSGENSGESHSRDHGDDHDYTFAFGHDNGAYGFQDEHGEYHGLWPDILHAVCEHAHKKCHWILDRSDHCWTQDDHYDHYEYPGVGILDHYYDACFGYIDTHERRNAFNFTVPIHPPSDIAVIIDEGKFEGDHHNLTGKTQGHVRGWQNLAECFDHQDSFNGHHEGEYQVHNYDTLHDVIEALHKGEIDFTIVPTDSLDPEHEHLHIVKPLFKCSEHGYSIMAHYDDPVIDWWNQHFHEVYEDGTLERLCDEAKTKYANHGSIHCFHH